MSRNLGFYYPCRNGERIYSDFIDINNLIPGNSPYDPNHDIYVLTLPLVCHEDYINCAREDYEETSNCEECPYHTRTPEQEINYDEWKTECDMIKQKYPEPIIENICME